MFIYIPTIFTLLFVPYIYLRAIRLIPCSPICKFLLLFIIVLISQSMLITQFLSSYFAPLHSFFMIIGGFVLSSMLIFTCFLFLRDFFLLFLFFITKLFSKQSFSLSVKLVNNKIHVLFLILACSFTAFGMYQALKVPDIKYQDIFIDNLPPDLENFTIAQLTDLHIGSTFTHIWLEKVVEKTNSLAPDLIAVTGDLIDGSPENIGFEIQSLKNLKGKYGTYFTLGNHEYYSDLELWLPYFQSMDLKFLLNENIEIKKGDAVLSLIGLTDKAHGEKYENYYSPDIDLATKNLSPNSIAILMAHQPSPAYEYSKYPIHLQLAGHTHGGLVFPLKYLVKKANNGFVSGLYQINNMQLYVSNGTGLWGFIPLRIGAPSEITLFSLKKKV